MADGGLSREGSVQEQHLQRQVMVFQHLSQGGISAAQVKGNLVYVSIF